MGTRPNQALAARRKVRDYPSLVVQEIQRLEADYGGRQGLIGMLALAPDTPDVQYFLGQLGDPRNAGAPLAEICARSNMLPGHLLHLLMEGSRLTAKARAAHIAQRGIAPVVEDLVRRAAPYEEDCQDCMVDGKPTGTFVPEATEKKPNPAPEPCPTCRGALRVRYMPELSRQELALDLAQLLPKGGGGINIALQQNNTNGGGAGGSAGLIDQIQQLTEQALYGDGMAVGPPETPPEAVDAEVVE